MNEPMKADEIPVDVLRLIAEYEAAHETGSAHDHANGFHVVIGHTYKLSDGSLMAFGPACHNTFDRLVRHGFLCKSPSGGLQLTDAGYDFLNSLVH